MKLYFLCENNEQLGPFSFDEIIAKGVDYNTPIWKDGFIGWAKAGEVDEFKTILLPPVPEKTPVKEQLDFKITRVVSLVGLVGFIVAALGFVVYKNLH